MLLQKLVEYASAHIEKTPPLYAERPIRYIVELDADGIPLNAEPTDTADPSESRAKKGVLRDAPYRKRSGTNAPPILLADHAGYTFGLPVPEKMSKQKAEKCFAAYTRLLERCAAATEEPAMAAVLRFLRSDPLSSLTLSEDFDESAALTFRVNGKLVIDLPVVQEFLAEAHRPQASNEDMNCIVCGGLGPVLKTHPIKIKGIRGGDSDLVSADKLAFQSYGLESSYNAPTCDSCANLYIKALNGLLATRENSYRIGGAAFVFWTREETGFSVRSFLDRPNAEEVRALIASAQSGRRSVPNETAFYATQLTRTEARAVVLDWIDTTVADVQRNLARWFRMQDIVRESGQEHRPLGIYSLTTATVPLKNMKPDMGRMQPSAPKDLLHAALQGTPLSHSLLHQALSRNKAEGRAAGKVTHPRAALIKLVLMSQTRNYDGEEDSMVSLNEEHPSPAYHCGRLLAELEAAQREAIPGANATITDRFYGTASTAPASVLPRLLRGAQPHLSKLERDRPGAYHALTRRIEEICDHILTFPRTLTLEGQGLFSLGYYHQRAHDRASAAEARARREGAEQSSKDLTKE